MAMRGLFVRGQVFIVCLVFLVFACTRASALPRRLIVAVDGIAYQDMKALQEGVICRFHGDNAVVRQAFERGYFSVSRNISTFPSTSDVSWTEMFGDRPVPGYQRTYYSIAGNAVIPVNGVTSSMEFEKQMTWRMVGSCRHAMSFVTPVRTFKWEVREFGKAFLEAGNEENFYAYIYSSDCAQHMSCDIYQMLTRLDQEIERLREVCRVRENRELEVLLVSDHGNNHAGRGKRVAVRGFLKRAGYRITKSIHRTNDVVLPTAGIESWVEVHNDPSQTEALLELLWHVPGVDIITAALPQPGEFAVVNWRGERAVIRFDSAHHRYSYTQISGDPLEYGPAMKELAARGQLDGNGFAPAEAWMRETLGHHYPLALERIVQAHTRVTLNPATILASLKNGYVHSGWLVFQGSKLMKSGGTHGSLDAANSTGILLSNFIRTEDTSAGRIAGLFDGFRGLREYRAEESGAEWVSARAQALTSIPRVVFDRSAKAMPPEQVLLRVWSPILMGMDGDCPIELSIRSNWPLPPGPIRNCDHDAIDRFERRLRLDSALALAEPCNYERLYRLPAGLVLQPQKVYCAVGRLQNNGSPEELFRFSFCTDAHGRPLAF